jgi:DNA-binding Xre family transcriptional regulator
MVQFGSLYRQFGLITSAQIRAGRALIRWSSSDLSDRSGVGTATIKRMEVMDGVPAGQVRTLMAIKEALEAAGVEFTGSAEDQPGVRLLTNTKQPRKMKDSRKS